MASPASPKDPDPPPRKKECRLGERSAAWIEPTLFWEREDLNFKGETAWKASCMTGLGDSVWLEARQDSSRRY